MKRKTERERFVSAGSKILPLLGWDVCTFMCGRYLNPTRHKLWLIWQAAKQQARREAQARGCAKCGHVKRLRPRRQAKREQEAKP